MDRLEEQKLRVLESLNRFDNIGFCDDEIDPEVIDYLYTKGWELITADIGNDIYYFKKIKRGQ